VTILTPMEFSLSVCYKGTIKQILLISCILNS